MEPIAIEQDADNLLRIKNLAMTYDLMYIALDDLMWVAFTFDHVKIWTKWQSFFCGWCSEDVASIYNTLENCLKKICMVIGLKVFLLNN